MKKAFLIVAAMTIAASAFAQEEEQQPPIPPPQANQTTVVTPRLRHEVRVQTLLFGNFFQATDPADEEDVTAFGSGYRLTYRPWEGRQTDFYGQLEYLTYSDIDRESSYGGRVGISHSDRVHTLEAFLDRAENRAAFDVGNRTAMANITTLNAEYGYRLNDLWQLGAEGTWEAQRFDVESDKENDYTALGASVRYRGFGYRFSPRIGYVVGQREVDNNADSYDDSYWYFQLSGMPTDKIYLSARYRGRDRSYSPVIGQLRREDDRAQWTAFANYRATQRLGLSMYYSQEATSSNLADHDFDTSFLVLGLTFYF